MEDQTKKGMFGDSDITRTSRHEAKRLRAYPKELLVRNDNIYHDHTPVKDFGPSQPPDRIDHLYSTLRGLIFSENVTVAKLRFAVHLAESGDSIDAYSNKEIAGIVGKCERTARSIRAWIGAKDITDSISVKKVAACSVVLTENSNKLDKKKVQIEPHVAKKSLGPEWALALQKMSAIRFNQWQSGEISVPQRARRIASWIARWGVEHVLHALWLAEGPSGATKRNLAGYVRSLVESGKKAPSGWVHPALRADDVEPIRHHVKLPEKPPADLLTTLNSSPFTYDPEKRQWSAETSASARDVLEKVESAYANDANIAWTDPPALIDHAEERSIGGHEPARQTAKSAGCAEDLGWNSAAALTGVPGSGAAPAEAGLLVLYGCRGIAPPFVYLPEDDVWVAPDEIHARTIYEVAHTAFGAKGSRINESEFSQCQHDGVQLRDYLQRRTHNKKP